MSKDRNWLDDFFGPPLIKKDDEELPERPVIILGDGLVAEDDDENGATLLSVDFPTPPTVPEEGQAVDETAGTGGTASDVANRTTTNVNHITFVQGFDDLGVSGFAGGRAGRVIYVTAGADKNVVLLYEDSGSSATNRILTGDASNITVGPGQTIALIYDANEERWRAAGAPGP